MSGGDIVFKIKNNLSVPVAFDKIEQPSGSVVNGKDSIAKTIAPGKTITMRLQRVMIETTVEATLFYHFVVNGTQVDFHAYAYNSFGWHGEKKSARYDFRAPGVAANQAIVIDGKTYSANFVAKDVDVKGAGIIWSEYNVDIALNVS